MYIIDTNALIYAAKQHINISKFLDEEILVPSSVLKELNSLSKENMYAKIAIKIANKFKIVNTDKSGDDGIIDVAIKVGGTVVTNDSDLRKRLSSRGINTISVTDGWVRF